MRGKKYKRELETQRECNGRAEKARVKEQEGEGAGEGEGLEIESA